MRIVLIKLFAIILLLLPVWAAAQAPYTDTTCSLSTRICTGQNYSYTAWTGPHPAQSGPSYGCLGQQNDPAWFYFFAGNTGDVHIHMYSNPCKDIDFICWGPFSSLDEGCNGGLIASKIIDCSYGSACIEDCDLPSMVNGQYYILLITNFSMQATTVYFNQSSGSGIMQCILPPTVSNTSPVCSGQNVQLNCSTISGGTYLWTGPGGFSSTQQNPLITNATSANAGTYSVVVTVGTLVLPAVNTTVTINPIPLPQLINPSSVCIGNYISLGGPPIAGYTYSWTSVPVGFTSTASNPMVTPLVNTVYSLTVTSAENCTASGNTSITVHPLPNVFVLPNSTVCQGSAIPLGGNPNPNYSYSWTSNPPGFFSNLANPVVIPSVTTTYTLVVTNQYSCPKTYSVTITLEAPPNAVTGPNQSICSGGTASLGTTAVPGNTYAWTSNPAGFTSTSSNPVVSPTITTTYTLTETNPISTCSFSNSVVITVSSGPLAITGPNTAVCLGNSVTLGTVAVPGNTYSWTSNPAGFTSNISNPVVSPTVTTTYSLTETAGVNCSTTHTVTVTVNPLPSAITGGPASVCQGSSATIGTSSIPGHTYQWTSLPPGFGSNLSNPSVSPSETTTYTLLETISATGCHASNSVTVTVNPLPVPGIIGNSPICIGASIFLGGMPAMGNTYSWTSNPAGFTSTQSNPSVSPIVNTVYTLVQTISATGCSKTASATITVNPLPLANAGSHVTACSGSPVTLGSAPVPGSTYQWSSNPPGFNSGISNPIAYPTVTTVYTLAETITATGCSNSHQVTATITPGPLVTLPAYSAVCKDAPAFALTGGNPPGGTYSGSGISNGFFNPVNLAPGTYTVFYSYTNAQGCSGNASQPIQVVIKPKITGSIRYMNTNNTLVDSCKIRLLDMVNTCLDSTTTTNGNYTFNCLSNATYKVRATVTRHWGGGNALDALLVAKYAVGMISFTDIQKKVADVNNNGSINSIDSYLIIRRWAEMIHSFPSGDWYITKNDTVVVNNQNVTVNFQALCFGDVDASYNLNGPNPAPESIPQQIRKRSLLENKPEFETLIPENALLIKKIIIPKYLQ